MKFLITASAAMLALSVPAFAAGDAAKGEREFNKCKACHMIHGESLAAAGEAGLVWDEENLASYVQDPKAFLVEYNDDPKARSSMSFKLAKGAEDVAAYLASVAPATN